jgi:ribulose-phosphate 3-epimerase
VACLTAGEHDQESIVGTAPASALRLHLGVKADPVEYRYSYDWLFSLCASEGVYRIQLGTFFELYQLPDAYFVDLAERATRHGVAITSIFSAHRELGGFMRDDGPGWDVVARRSYERLIEVGAILQVESVGASAGGVLRDHIGHKDARVATYLSQMKVLMHFAREAGIHTLTIEPMSCLAEPPTLPEEIAQFGRELSDYHAAHASSTAAIGMCTDVAHGYVDEHGRTVWDNMQLLEAALPGTTELHLKNTDARFDSTFGFTDADRAKGVVDITAVRDLLLGYAGRLPVRELTGYLEIGGPRVGRDWSDRQLEGLLRGSLRYLKSTFVDTRQPEHGPVLADATAPFRASDPVLVSPSLMCADHCRLAAAVETLESLGVQMLHFDLMDANYVPNLTLGLVAVEQLRRCTELPFDVHLMVLNNDLLVREVLRIGVQQVCVHAESAVHLDRTLALIRSAGVRAGVALNPGTPLTALEYVTESLDFVLLMTVNPGFAGQSLVPSSMRKIADCRALLDRTGRHIPLEVDGNVSFEHIPDMVAAGADILVAGTSSLFARGATLRRNGFHMMEAMATGLERRTARCVQQ